MIRDGDVVTAQFASSPAGYVEPFIIKGQVNVSDERRNCFETLQHGRQEIRVRRFSRNFDYFGRAPMTIIALPQSDRRREILQRNDHSGEAKCSRRIMRGSQFENHLLFFAQFDRLQVLPPPKIPDVELVTVTAGKQVFRIDPVLDLVRNTPFTCDHRVVAEMPPEIISQFLRSTIPSQRPSTLKSKWSKRKIPPGPPPFGAPRALT